MSLPLTELVQSTFESIPLHEQDVISYENYVYSTAEFDLSGTIGNYEINVNLSASDLIANLQEAYHLVCWKQTKSDGTDYAAAYVADTAETIAATIVPNSVLVNSAWSLFKDYRIEVNSETFDEVKYPGQVFNILTKASKSRDWINTNGPDMHYYPAVDAADVTDTKWVEGGTRDEAAFRAGFIWSKIYLRDVLGSANMKKVLPQCNFVFRMNKDTQYGNNLFRGNATNLNGHATTNTDAGIKIKHIRLVLPCLKVKDRLLNEIMSKSVLENRMVPLDWLQIGYSKVVITPSAGQLSTVPLFSGVRKPRMVFVAPQLVSVTAAQNSGNPSIYVSNATSEMFIQVNGRQFPFHRFTPEALGYQDAVEALHRAYGNDDIGRVFNTINFKTFHSIYFFDISKVDSVFEENGAGPLIQINYNSADNNTPLNLHCVYLAERHNALQYLGNSMRIVSVEK